MTFLGKQALVLHRISSLFRFVAFKKLILVLIPVSKFCDWVEENEPTTLTYCVMTRPEAPNEVLMFERYKDLPALGVHGKSKQFKDML